MHQESALKLGTDSVSSSFIFLASGRTTNLSNVSLSRTLSSKSPSIPICSALSTSASWLKRHIYDHKECRRSPLRQGWQHEGLISCDCRGNDRRLVHNARKQKEEKSIVSDSPLIEWTTSEEKVNCVITPLNHRSDFLLTLLSSYKCTERCQETN